MASPRRFEVRLLLREGADQERRDERLEVIDPALSTLARRSRPAARRLLDVTDDYLLTVGGCPVPAPRW